jgi:hypothetical protein
MTVDFLILLSCITVALTSSGYLVYEWLQHRARQNRMARKWAKYYYNGNRQVLKVLELNYGRLEDRDADARHYDDLFARWNAKREKQHVSLSYLHEPVQHDESPSANPAGFMLPNTANVHALRSKANNRHQEQGDVASQILRLVNSPAR